MSCWLWLWGLLWQHVGGGGDGWLQEQQHLGGWEQVCWDGEEVEQDVGVLPRGLCLFSAGKYFSKTSLLWASSKTFSLAIRTETLRSLSWIEASSWTILAWAAFNSVWRKSILVSASEDGKGALCFFLPAFLSVACEVGAGTEEASDTLVSLAVAKDEISELADPGALIEEVMAGTNVKVGRRPEKLGWGEKGADELEMVGVEEIFVY